MSDISNQLIKDSYNYVLQSDLSTGNIYRIGGSIPVNPKFLSGLTINTNFNFSNGSERAGYVLTSDGSGNASWGPVSGGSGVQSVTGDGVNNTDPLNPVISQNSKVNVIKVTLGNLGLSQFSDDTTMLLLSKLYLNSLNQNIPYDTLYQLEITEGSGTTPTYSFISTWSANTNQTISLPYLPDGTYTGVIDWDDGSQSINSYSNRQHTYTNAGIYTIKITGTIIGFRFLSLPNTSNILEIKQWGNIILSNNFNTSAGYYFYQCNNLVLTGVTDTLNLSNTPDLTYMFYLCTSLTTINNGNNWDVSNVTGMTGMFAGCTNFNQPIGSWNVSKVTTMFNMFASCTNFNQSINSWNVSGVTRMDSMFQLVSNFNQPLSGWNVSKVTRMDYMFYGNSNFNQPIGNWNVSGVTRMDNMFRSATIFNQPLSGWNVSNVTNMSSMFQSATNFNKNIGNWNVSSVTGMTNMFSSSSFNNEGSPSISGWTTSNVLSMANMFLIASFNQPIGSWDTSKVTNMQQMFAGAVFNQNIGNWDLSKNTFTLAMFSNNTSFNNGGSSSINNWNVSGVTNMSQMFANATSFNQPIGSWNVSNVTSFDLFMVNKTNLNYSSTNLNLIYNGWSTKNPKTGLTINFGSIKYTSEGSAGKAILTGSTLSGGYGWTITDGGI